MKSTIFLCIAIFVYVDADIYTITISDIQSYNDAVLSIVDENSSDGPDVNMTCPDNYVIVREAILDTPLYDGYARYVDISLKKPVLLCNNDVTELSGTMSYILLNSLGFLSFDDEIACPIDPGVTCLQKEFKMASGYFEGVFENNDDVTLEVKLPALLTASFSISKEDGFPTPEPAEDRSEEERFELEEKRDANDTEAQGEANDSEAQGEESDTGEEQAGGDE